MLNPFGGNVARHHEPADSGGASGTVCGERYRIIRPLGRGANNSRTVLAADLAGGREVALS